ncbi:MAG: sn-glycerol-3-phosphate ABC transporter ATP-binding protein UgpC [Rhodothermales bacterium]|nr:sn-glycerol-3-phosphate ABC transporter ATP-binding protein UgpC [Rhodothermales bacterium]
MAEVRLEEVRKVYGNGHVAVHGATFSVDEGELVVLVGPSGCGKSTLLRMIAGLERITAGQLFLDGQRANDVPPRDRDVAMVFQHHALYPHMTVADNLAFGLKLRRYPKAEQRVRVRRAAEVLGLLDVLDRKPQQLSGGQQQRVALGRALVRKPRVFLLDEPLSNLDARLRVQMRTEIARLHRRLGATMLYVTHDQVEAMTLGRRLVVLRDGRIQQIDAPLALYHHPVNRFVAAFIGSPAMNFVEGRLVREGGGLCFREAGGPLAVPVPPGPPAGLVAYTDRAVVLGIRPEDLAVAGGPQRAGPTAEATLTLDVVEPLGNEVLVYARTPRQQLIARVPPQPLPAPGEPLHLALALDRLHFFDAETEEAIG